MPAAKGVREPLLERGQDLDVFFKPGTVAVIGATENAGSVGRSIFWNLVSSPFGGAVFPINPKRPSVLGVKAYKHISEVPGQVDLAVVVTPAATVPGVIHDCAAQGVRGAIVISAGFKETGPAGVELEQQIMREARRGKMRIIGPNCLGAMCPLTGLNATFAANIARPGNVGFISQSGALCTAVLDWSLREMVGFSAFLSLGSMLDVGWGDLIDYLGNDPRTRSIVIYMESIGDARAFISAAREVALTKPIIVVKAGRSEAAAKAAASHTGSLAGSDEVLEAAFRRIGVLRVNHISDLFYMSDVLSKQPSPKGPRLTILTNAGGPGVLAADALIAGGCELSAPAPATMEALNGILPGAWSHNNPIDVLGDASPERYSQAVEIAAKDPDSDGLLVILTPQSMTDPTQTAERLKPYAKLEGKPIIASWMGGAHVAAGESILNSAGIPTFPFPDSAARAFSYMWKWAYNLKGLYETPSLPEDSSESAPDHALAHSIIQTARGAGRTILTESESKQVLASYGLPIVETLVAESGEQAVAHAGRIGYPVVLKLLSKTITHKTDVGGVQLNLGSAKAVERAWHAIRQAVTVKAGAEHFQGVTVQPMIDSREAYELILGSSLDPQFGPVLLFGTGGQLVEVFRDRSLGLPPLNTTLARRMMEQTRIYKALQGVRGRKPVDLASLERIMVRFSRLVVEQRWIKEIDINPLLASAERLVALDARVVLHGADVSEEQLPKLAVRPYPARYVSPFTMKDGAEVTLRPIRPEDEPLIARFHETLSERSVYLRYFRLMNLPARVAHDRLTRICFIDYDREMALVAERRNPATGEREILAVGRLTKIPGTDTGEIAVLVSDQWQGRGLGRQLVARLKTFGADEKLGRLTADILPDNQHMIRIFDKLGFSLRHSMEDGVMKAELLF